MYRLAEVNLRIVLLWWLIYSNGIREKAQKKLEGANKDLEDLVGVRSRQIERKLRGVQLMSGDDAEKLLGEE